MAGASGQFRRGNEQFILSDAASSKCHVNQTLSQPLLFNLSVSFLTGC